MQFPGSLNMSLRVIHSRYLAQLMPQLLPAWRWWTSELYALLPTKLRTLVETNNQQLIVSVAGDELLFQHKKSGQIQDIGRVHTSTCDTRGLSLPDNIRQTILVLPQGKVLSRELTLPLATEKNLREVLSFEMDKLTPFTEDHVYYEYLVTKRRASEKMLCLEIFVVPRDILDDSTTRLESFGLHPDIIIPHPADNARQHNVNLMPTTNGINKGMTAHRLNQSLMVLAVLLSILTLTLPILQKNQVIGSLEKDIRQAMTGASASSQLRQEVEKLITGSKFLVNKKQNEKTMMHLLNEMSRVIPDNTWVNRIDINREEVQLQGQSGSAAGLIALIEESPTFHSAQFRSPITQVARTTQERFHLAAKFRQGTTK
jgi:general secretion pathway protein L